MGTRTLIQGEGGVRAAACACSSIPREEDVLLRGVRVDLFRVRVRVGVRVRVRVRVLLRGVRVDL